MAPSKDSEEPISIPMMGISLLPLEAGIAGKDIPSVFKLFKDQAHRQKCRDCNFSCSGSETRTKRISSESGSSGGVGGEKISSGGANHGWKLFAGLCRHAIN